MGGRLKESSDPGRMIVTSTTFPLPTATALGPSSSFTVKA
jgi:hypothetical protein